MAPGALYDVPVTTIMGEQKPFGEFSRGKVALVVNTASACGLTPQYAGLEELYQRFSSRGFTVIGCDGQPAGVVDDVWIDRSEYLLRYLQVGVGLTGRPALLPMTMAVVEGGQRRVRVHAVTAEQFLRVPQTKSPDQVTLLEEDKIVGYYGGGHLYATPDRQEPWL
jgi:hypothetical protein